MAPRDLHDSENDVVAQQRPGASSRPGVRILDSTNQPIYPEEESTELDPSPSDSWLEAAKVGLRTSVKLILEDAPVTLQIKDSVGKLSVHDLSPAAVEAQESIRKLRKLDSVGPLQSPSSGAPRFATGSPSRTDSIGPVRRDSLGMQMLVNKDSWAPEARSRRRSPSTLRDVIRSVMSWIILLALSIDLLAILLEPLFVTRGGAPLRPAIAAAFASIGLALFFAVVAGPVAATAHALVRLIGRLRKGWRFLWPWPLVLLAWVVVSNLAPHKVIQSRSLLQGQVILAALFSASLIVGMGITRIKRGRVRVALGVSITVFAFWLNSVMSPILKREPRDLLWLSAIFCFSAILYPLRRHIAALPHERVSRLFGYVLVGSLVCLGIAPVIAPDWRTHASLGGRFAPRLARFARQFGDLDTDGFSAIAWGTDCDDNDSGLNPATPEKADGRDRNCNGSTRPKDPTPEQRGLTPAFGEPDAPNGTIDRVILVTVDCFRNDALTADYMPNLVRLAERGVRLEKLYSSGARTAMSLPFMLRGAFESPTVAELLGKEQITSTAIFGYNHPTVDRNVFTGFGKVLRPELLDHRIRAPELTDMALADLRDDAHKDKHLLWIHYFDAHGPRNLGVLPKDVPTFPPMVGETDKDSALYLSELTFIDRHIGRLVEGIEATGGFGRTIMIVTNDHGEGFGRHGVYEHGVSAFEAIIHAPGILLAPSIPPGKYSHVAAQRDIAATILGAFGLVAKHPEIETFGRSWLRLSASPGEALHDFVFTYETTTPFERWGDAPMASITDDHGKLSVSYVDGISRFYRLDYDPTEDFELGVARPDEVRGYRARLETFRDLDMPPH